jgi:murein L,D-transpeptidase YafK
MKILTCIVTLTLFVSTINGQNNFLDNQKKYKRVQNAFKDKKTTIENKLETNGIKINELNILLIAYKQESQLIVYAKNKNELGYKKVETYKICSKSGFLGPKREQGDYQVPEGYYHINRFNPFSSFHLSLGINYPNKSDRIKSNAVNRGGDIFIHGDCVTIGCLPLTDDKIKEVYCYSVLAKNNLQGNIPVYIYPYKMTKTNHYYNCQMNNENNELIKFWKNLKTGYDLFQLNKEELNFQINNQGNYIIKKNS